MHMSQIASVINTRTTQENVKRILTFQSSHGMVTTVIDTKTKEIKLALSRQDYNAIANIAKEVYLKEPNKFNKVSETYQADYREGVSELVFKLADYFKLTNDRFDTDRFMKATGIEGRIDAE